MLRIIAIATVGTLLFASPASARDPLLSGYGGPGGGEQAVLGDQLAPPAGGRGDGPGGSGSLRAAPAQAAADRTRSPAPQAAAPVPAPAGEEQPAAATPRRAKDRKPSGTSAKDRGAAGSGAAERRNVAPPARRHAGAPPVIPYPARATDAGAGLPLSAQGVAVLALCVAALALVGAGLRRLQPRREGLA